MSKVTGYSYLLDHYIDPETNSLKEVYRPMISIRISKDRGQISPLFDALVDSGSDRNLFPMYFASKIGLNLSKHKPRKVYGIGGHVISFTARINLWIGSSRYETEADFSSGQQMPLLGRNGFFNLFKSIKFDEKEKFFYIEE